jgi:hypothetical protein
MSGFAKHLIVQLSTRFNLVRPPPSVPPLKQIFHQRRIAAHHRIRSASPGATPGTVSLKGIIPQYLRYGKAGVNNRMLHRCLIDASYMPHICLVSFKI